MTIDGLPEQERNQPQQGYFNQDLGYNSNKWAIVVSLSVQWNSLVSTDRVASRESGGEICPYITRVKKGIPDA